jgi:hypothetical protein
VKLKASRSETKPGKHSNLAVLPNQRTLQQLTNPLSAERLVNNYAKVTPSGINALDAPNINEMDQVKV